MNIIPGVRQDHTGKLYHIGIDTAGNQHVIPYVEESPEANPNLAKVVVHSKSRLPFDGMAAWVAKAIENGYLFKQGDIFVSLLCFQKRKMEL